MLRFLCRRLCVPRTVGGFFRDRVAVIGQFSRYLVCLATTCFLLATPVASATDLSAMDRAAIAVKAPDKVVLVAITNAGNRLVAVGEHGVIIVSDDSGRNWRQAQVPVDVTLTCVAFANAQDGWAAGHYGVILHTTDGGLTWQRQLDGIQDNQMTLAAAQAAAAANDPSPGTPLAMARAAHFMAGGPDNPFLTIIALDPDHAMVFGAYRMAVNTTDGGQHWQEWDLHVGDPISHNLYGAARVGVDLYLVGEAGSVFRSTDNGASFPAVTVPAQSTLFMILPTGNGGLFTCGVAGLAFRSADNGQTWTPVDLNTTSNLTAGAVLRSGAIIVGNEAGAIEISTDHAQTFTTLPGFQPMEIFGLTQAADGDVVAVGSAGVSVIPAKDFLQS
jgi:photosystem II stability/assembly factor-like uncharacterized protein